MVFGVETAIRSLWRKPFCSRGAWGTYSAIIFVVVVTTMLWLSCFLIPTSDTCIGDLVWWTQHYAFIAVVLAPIIILINAVSSVTVVAQLLRTTKVAMDERIMATRYIFTSGLSTFILVSHINSTALQALLTSQFLLLPYYIQILIDQDAETTSNIADIALQLAGIFNFLIFLFVSKKYDQMIIQPLAVTQPKSQTQTQSQSQSRTFEPSNGDPGIVISAPIIAQRSDGTDLALIGADSGKRSVRPDIFHSANTQYTSNVRLPPPPPRPEPVALSSQQMNTRSSYSIFPTSHSIRPISWSTVRTTSDMDGPVQLPAPLFASRYHDNGPDEGSTTVKIGLRLSDAARQEEEDEEEEEEDQPESPLLPFYTRPSSPGIVLQRSKLGQESKTVRSSDGLMPDSQPSSPKSFWSRKRASISSQISKVDEVRPRTDLKSLPPIPALTPIESASNPWLPPESRTSSSWRSPPGRQQSPGIPNKYSDSNLQRPPSTPRYTPKSPNLGSQRPPSGLPFSPRPLSKGSITNSQRRPTELLTSPPIPPMPPKRPAPSTRARPPELVLGPSLPSRSPAHSPSNRRIEPVRKPQLTSRSPAPSFKARFAETTPPPRTPPKTPIPGTYGRYEESTFTSHSNAPPMEAFNSPTSVYSH